ncbi:hypothetical protein CRM22_003669 [Opisthorchis felineus]|uniref:SRCR domain-containing protein n=1 Tax=Opisthorchis felineus TaxID=147828 RepID=A0A4S2M040_OPIFE|nr:hypothetical protein CRM22_003669 [Opisthorchis felineus]
MLHCYVHCMSRARGCGIFILLLWMFSDYSLALSSRLPKDPSGRKLSSATCDSDWTPWKLVNVMRRDCTISFVELKREFPCIAVQTDLRRQIRCNTPFNVVGIDCKYDNTSVWECIQSFETNAFLCVLDPSTYMVESMISLDKVNNDPATTSNTVLTQLQSSDLESVNVDKCYRMAWIWKGTVIICISLGAIAPTVGLLLLLWFGYARGFCNQLCIGYAVKDSSSWTSSSDGTYRQKSSEETDGLPLHPPMYRRVREPSNLQRQLN